MHKIYFYSKPNFLFIDSETIVDLDLTFFEERKVFDIKFSDNFFYNNFKKSKSKNWEITIQSFDEKNNFVLQSNISGDLIKTNKTKKYVWLRFEYDQITNNKVWPSLPPAFEEAESDFKRAKLSFVRQEKLKDILTKS